jgi:hypothetical protein
MSYGEAAWIGGIHPDSHRRFQRSYRCASEHRNSRKARKKKTSVFRKPTTAGWFLILLTIAGTAAAINTEVSSQRDKDELKRRYENIHEALAQAGKDAEKKQRDLDYTKTSLNQTKASLDQALAALSSQAEFAKSEATAAAERPNASRRNWGEHETTSKSSSEYHRKKFRSNRRITKASSELSRGSSKLRCSGSKLSLPRRSSCSAQPKRPSKGLDHESY